MTQLDMLLGVRVKPYKVKELKAALRAIGSPIPYLSQLRRHEVIEQIPTWLTTPEQERLFRELKRRSKAA